MHTQCLAEDQAKHMHAARGLTCDVLRAHLGSVQSHSEAPAVCQVGAYGLRAAEGVGVVIYGNGLVVLRQLQYLQHVQRGYKEDTKIVHAAIYTAKPGTNMQQASWQGKCVADASGCRTCVSEVSQV